MYYVLVLEVECRAVIAWARGSNCLLIVIKPIVCRRPCCEMSDDLLGRYIQFALNSPNYINVYIVHSPTNALFIKLGKV
jgi:hypothetical protein